MASKRRKKGVVRNYVDVPDDLTLVILRRLPKKSLLRFRCVCKQWLSLISDNKKLLLVSSSSSSSCIKYVDFEDEEASNGNVKPKLLFDFPYKIDIIGCCDGLLCILVEEKHVLLFNPSTGTCKSVKKSEYFYEDKGNSPPFQFGLGYDRVTDDYKIVKLYARVEVLYAEFQIYSLNTDSWIGCKRFGCPIDIEPVMGSKKFGISVDGALYWSIELNRALYVGDKGPFHCILRFDLTDEEYSWIDLPCNLGKNGHKPEFDLVDFGGRLCMLHSEAPYHIDMWVLVDQNYCKEKLCIQKVKWIKVMMIPVVPSSVVEQVLQKSYCHQYYKMSAVFCFNNGIEVLLNIRMISTPEGTITNEFYCLYNDEEKRFKRLDIRDAQEFYQHPHLTYNKSLIYLPLLTP